MRSGLSAIASLNNITAQWVFEVDGNYWTFGNDITYDSNNYTSKIVTESFTGIKEKNTRYADKMIPPNTTEFSITGDKTDFSPPDFIGEDVLVTLLNDGVKVYSWRFSVKSCDYAYGKFNFTCEDFLQKYLFDKYYPNTELLNSYNDTTAQMEGPDNAVVPQVFGTAYPQLRMIPDSSQWYPVLGAVAGTYTVNKISSPVEFVDKISVYEPPTYTFTQSTISSLRVFANNIGSGGVNAPFGKSGKLYDLPTQFSNSLTVGVTSPADIISYILQVLGVPAAQIDSAGTFATTKTTLATLGITYNYCFTTKEDAVKVLCELLQSCNCIMPRSDVVQLIALEDGVAVKTIDRDNILNLNFSGKTYTDDFDGAYATYFTTVQDGEPSEIVVPINGVSAVNLSGEKTLYKYTTDTQIIQKLSIIDYRRKFLQTGTVSFSSNHSMLEPYLGDRIDISDDLYEDYENVYVDQISISPDLKFDFSLDAYSEVIGDLTDYSPSAVTKTTDLSPFVVPFLLDNLLVGTNLAGTHLENSAILSGQTNYDTGNGWFLGRQGDFPKFSLRNSTGQYLRFGNNNLETSGLTVTSATGIGNFTDSGDLAEQDRADLDYTDGADVTKTIIDGGLITTGRITNNAVLASSTLDINFDTAKITVNAASGLEINSAGGLQVNSSTGIVVNSGGDITVNAGGDVKLKSSAVDQAQLQFYNFSNAIAGFIGMNTAGTFLELSPTTTGKSVVFGGTDLWQNVSSYAYEQTRFFSGNSTYNADITAYSLSNEVIINLTAEASTKNCAVELDCKAAAGNLNLSADDSIKKTVSSYSQEMTSANIEIHRGMRQQAQGVTTYDSLLGVGDFYFYQDSTFLYQQWARVRSATSTYLDQRVF